MYSYDEVMTFVEEEDVKFIRLAFCDVHGRQKNVSIMPSELKKAFSEGISFDASALSDQTCFCTPIRPRFRFCRGVPLTAG